MNKENIKFEILDLVGTVVHIAIDKEYDGYIVISDEVKEDSKKAINKLKEIVVKKTVMLTGDAISVGEKVGEFLGIDEVHAELLPDQKVEQLERLDKARSVKEKLAFVRDGINDAPVLARADIGIATMSEAVIADVGVSILAIINAMRIMRTKDKL
ncbi:HAD-IC family P-type ATPase [Tissierella creatinophila]|uniref:Cd(2+)-exporting ATPase n=1 Tax=Tissierella creatinophila DSM 6911 TaxID=1123403 RepID=A0A1U7M8G4_TISCR|nr:HAD-IC family P-type ATPase [Tissierella creatinophila]OLS03571.1 zinc-transporting ATPase [Tissierella creatinophila DSM 6911]